MCERVYLCDCILHVCLYTLVFTWVASLDLSVKCRSVLHKNEGEACTIFVAALVREENI